MLYFYRKMQPVLIPTLLLFFLLIFLSPVQAQTYRSSEVKEYLSLKDRVQIFPVFVNTLTETWEEEEIDYYYGELEKAEDWLIAEAGSYNQFLEFDNEYFDLDLKAEIDLDDVPRRKNPRQTIQKVMVELGYNDFEDFLNTYSFDFEKEKMKIVLFVKSNRRSHAYNYWSVKDVDLAIIYCRQTIGMLSNYQTIAHEILHQFGAWDLYYELGKTQTKKSAAIARETYPSSIMISTRRGQNPKTVDAVTAWRVGWSEKEDSFDTFDPVLNKEEMEKEWLWRNLDKN